MESKELFSLDLDFGAEEKKKDVKVEADSFLSDVFSGGSQSVSVASPSGQGATLGGLNIAMGALDVDEKSVQVKKDPLKLYAEACKLYQFGYATGMDVLKAVELFEELVPMGHAAATCSYGECLLWGHGVKQDKEKALANFQTSAAKGYAPAHVLVGSCFRDGHGVKRDTDKASAAFAKAMAAFEADEKKGDVEARYWIGRCCAEALGMDLPDWDRAVDMLGKAADAGHSNAQYHLGMYYATGPGRNQGDDAKEKARGLLEKASKQGHPKAKKELAALAA